MKKIRRVAIGIVFRNFPDEIKFLLLRRKQGWKGWEFPKGGIEQGETNKEAVIREVHEETGLKRIKFLKRVGKPIKYNYPKESRERFGSYGTVQKAFLVKAITTNVNVEKESFSGYGWFTAKEALKSLRWYNQRTLLRSVLKAGIAKK
ncbi:MAG: NUDIX domain-containing protein [Candidatus Aenigmatarchaeota archaeon]